MSCASGVTGQLVREEAGIQENRRTLIEKNKIKSWSVHRDIADVYSPCVRVLVRDISSQCKSRCISAARVCVCG